MDSKKGEVQQTGYENGIAGFRDFTLDRMAQNKSHDNSKFALVGPNKASNWNGLIQHTISTLQKVVQQLVLTVTGTGTTSEGALLLKPTITLNTLSLSLVGLYKVYRYLFQTGQQGAKNVDKIYNIWKSPC